MPEPVKKAKAKSFCSDKHRLAYWAAAKKVGSQAIESSRKMLKFAEEAERVAERVREVIKGAGAEEGRGDERGD